MREDMHKIIVDTGRFDAFGGRRTRRRRTERERRRAQDDSILKEGMLGRRSWSERTWRSDRVGPLER
ncbi:MAG: hypothetical protein O2816_04120 [Planctomycetota bacterium]|nr:hypothetical protein [Planctomycetota bacterium]